MYANLYAVPPFFAVTLSAILPSQPKTLGIFEIPCARPLRTLLPSSSRFREGAKLVGNRDVISERIAKRGRRRSSPHPSICWGAELINLAQSRHWQGPSSRTTVSWWWLINHHLKARREDAATMCSAAHGLTVSAGFRIAYAVCKLLHSWTKSTVRSRSFSHVSAVYSMFWHRCVPIANFVKSSNNQTKT